MNTSEKEIGGYFGLEQLPGKEFYPHLIKVNSGRNALLYLLKARNIRKLYIPFFLCDSVSVLCDRLGYEYEYYSIGKDWMPVFDKPLSPDTWLYVVNYYGQLSNKTALWLKEKYTYMIFDNVQAFFQPPVDGIDTIYSCRKFFGVPDGGYVATDAILEDTLPLDISKDRMKHILGRYEGTGSEYYRDFQENDESFYTLDLREMSKLTQNILRAIDYDFVRCKRNENYALLASTLDVQNPLPLTVPDGPYCYPFYCADGMVLKKKLAQKKIYVATLWPNVLQLECLLEKDYAENLLPLPCDQRYGVAEIKKILEEIKSCLKI